MQWFLKIPFHYPLNSRLPFLGSFQIVQDALYPDEAHSRMHFFPHFLIIIIFHPILIHTFEYYLFWMKGCISEFIFILFNHVQGETELMDVINMTLKFRDMQQLIFHFWMKASQIRNGPLISYFKSSFNFYVLFGIFEIQWGSFLRIFWFKHLLFDDINWKAGFKLIPFPFCRYPPSDWLQYPPAGERF